MQRSSAVKVGISFTHHVDAACVGALLRAQYILSSNDVQSAGCSIWLTFVKQPYICLTCMTTLNSVAHAALMRSTDTATDAVHEKR